MNGFQPCPNCGADASVILFRVAETPVHSVVLIKSYEAALAYPKGQILLAHCERCDFIGNRAFNPESMAYGSEYESTQSWSPTFNAFNAELANDLIDRYGLRRKKVVEIGCGQGEFLKLLCEMGRNEGLGFDPAYVGSPLLERDGYEVQFIKEKFPSKEARVTADLICCKMTLEHIPNTREFMLDIRRSIPQGQNPILFIQVPDAGRILRKVAFWDIYYEHCSYFTIRSLQYVVEECGFEVLRLTTAYAGQYILLEARWPGQRQGSGIGKEPDLRSRKASSTRAEEVEYFSEHIELRMEKWQELIDAGYARGEKIVIWGAGSKAVALLNALGIHDQIRYAVDINPKKQNTYLAGTGQRIVTPEFLKDYGPGSILVMNPVYVEEIQATVDALGIATRLIPVQ